MSVLGPSLASSVKSSRGLYKFLKPLADKYASLSGYRAHGLKYDDILIEENLTVRKVSIGRATVHHMLDIGRLCEDARRDWSRVRAGRGPQQSRCRSRARHLHMLEATCTACSPYQSSVDHQSSRLPPSLPQLALLAAC